MFQVATNWMLINLPEDFGNASSEITLRGYSSEEPVAIPAEFVIPAEATGKDARRPSVENIASIYCPTRRDLFLQLVRRKRGISTWGRIAGPLIESYCVGLLDEYETFFDRDSRNYGSISKEISQYTEVFINSNRRQFLKLRSKSTDIEQYKHFLSSLEYTGRSELAMLGSHWTLNDGGDPDIEINKDNTDIKPKSLILGISSPSTPDFLLPGVNAVGDVKSGLQFMDFHKLTCAGYALAYESENGPGTEINFGVIYFFQTQQIHQSLTSAKTYAFLIDDRLRREFLDRRNQAYRIIRRDDTDPPPLADRDRDCAHCKFLNECYPDE